MRFEIESVDAAGFADVLRRNAPEIRRIVAEQAEADVRPADAMDLLPDYAFGARAILERFRSDDVK